MTTSPGRWLAPVGASAAVLAVFVVPGVVVTAADGGADPGPGFNPPTSTPEPARPSGPRRQADRQRADIREVEIVGYQATGRKLRIYYTVDQSSDCSSRIEPPDVQETASAVLVRLDRRPSRAPDQVCTHLLLTNSVDIALSRPLGARALQDASLGGALVPAEPSSAGGSDRPTPPVSRAGR
jgi:hypothetical protein